MSVKKFSKEDLRFILKNEKELKKVARMAFNVVDKDRSGQVTYEELESLMVDVATKVGCQKPSKDEVIEALKTMDTDNDGHISIQEFTVLIKEILMMMLEL
jgi:Ca2+-binding EF-hand superfamily protein